MATVIDIKIKPNNKSSKRRFGFNEVGYSKAIAIHALDILVRAYERIARIRMTYFTVRS